MAPDAQSALWIKDPLAILADGAERGILVEDGRIIELVGSGREPRTPAFKTFDAGAHVVLPGLINTHHHFYQTLTRAVPAALDRELFPWLEALYPLWARLTPEAVDLASTLAISALRRGHLDIDAVFDALGEDIVVVGGQRAARQHQLGHGERRG